MAFWLNRSGRQMVRLSSSSWAAKPQLLRVLTSVNNNNNNCFSTAASSNPKDDAALKADMIATCREYFAKNLANLVQNKPLSFSEADWHKFLDDLLEKLTHVDSEKKDSTSEIDQSKINPKTVTAEMIKATAEFGDFIISGGLLKHLKPAFKVKEDKFNFALDTNGLYLTVNVSRLGKEQLVVLVVRDRVVVASSYEVPPDQMVREVIQMPEDLNYDPDEVTGTIMEDGQLKISFPVSKEGGAEEKVECFEVNLV